MLIREETTDDIGAVRRLNEAAFGRSDEAQLVDKLRDGKYAVLSLVAREGHDVVGHVMLSQMGAPFKALGLAPVAVIPSCQRQGIGSGLIREALDWARRNQCDAVFVLGDPAYYQRFGFSLTEAQGFSCAYVGDHFMVAALQSNLPAKTGKIDYAPPFDELG